MKLIMEYDSWAYNGSEAYEASIPIEYSSKEKILEDFELALDVAIKQRTYYFEFLGKAFYVEDFQHRGEKRLPKIRSLFEWFMSKRLIESNDSNIHECDMSCGFGISCGAKSKD